MSRDSRIAYIINQLGELRELLLVIEQAGQDAPGILLKLAREKAESIDRSTRELRSSQFWAELQKHDPFDSVAPQKSEAPNDDTDTPADYITAETEEHHESHPAEEVNDSSFEDSFDEPWNMPVTPTQEVEIEEPVLATTIEEEAEPTPEPAPHAKEHEVQPAPSVHEETPLDTPAAPSAETPVEKEEPLYPWEQMSDEELSAAQDDHNDYDDDTDDTDYDEADYEDTPTADLPADDTSAPVTLEEALQRQQAKELRKALSLNDRFRFRRELFGNSDIRMNETLALIDAMNSYEEAEDYILNDLNWDMDNPEVAEFMKIVQKHFL
ncbi:hypothetical protein [Barnesiella sp. An55]|uniref:hypothetical protein n=1 Tax=Barnesiella sp. An55 TaxID=1965646 RepID=UPI000B373920|nr:hypothetical protein [Barnesiella sp. An55]OUN72637.1 hypothetical protein B5G10_07060 [Barnesiella sp. An55]